MNQKDIEFLTTNIASFCGIPIRIYDDNKYIFFYHTSSFLKDPVILHETKIFNSNDKINYFITDDFFYYAFLNYRNYKVVLGPFRLSKFDDTYITKVAFSLELSKEEIPNFISTMKTISTMSLESVLQVLCLLYFVLSGEKITIKDILIDDDKVNEINNMINQEKRGKEIEEGDLNYINNSLAIEKELYKIVENGDVAELQKWIKNAPPIRPGALSSDNLRHTKNTFIVVATLTSRAAIRGNMDAMHALALSDLYIQKMELLQNSSDIYFLQMNMILDYTKVVAKIKNKNNTSSLLISLNKYILSHLSDPIKSDDLCEALYISKSALFKKVKDETNMTLSNYILSVKINESKELLRYTNKSIAAISIYLGFSSQSHFNHAFKKFMNTTPIKYRNNK